MGLHLQQARIAWGLTVKGDYKLLYIGPDSAKCDAAVAEAGTEFAEAGAIPRGTVPTVVRYPNREALNLKQRAKDAELREENAKNARRIEAEKKAAEGKRLTAEASVVLKELSKSDK